MKTIKVKVSDRALLARINRKLLKEDRIVKKCRPDSRSYHDLGDYYMVDLRSNGVLFHYKNLDLSKLAKELELLKPYEELATS